MARIFITGSADGLGLLTAKQLLLQGHSVTLHARNQERATHTWREIPDADNVLVADLSSIEETKQLAAIANASGRFDAVIHNAGVYRLTGGSTSIDGLPVLFAVNSLAPYLLTCLMHQPKRLIYLSSGMHLSGNTHMGTLLQQVQSNRITYADTKLHDVILSMAVARKWSDTCSNAVNPGWVPTKMGGASAPDNLEKGYQTQVWLATSEAAATISGGYFHHQKQAEFLAAANDEVVQDKLLAVCKEITGIDFPVSGS